MLIILFSICLVIFLICGIIYFRNEPDPAYFNTDALFDTPKFFNYYDSPYQIKDPTMFISTLETLEQSYQNELVEDMLSLIASFSSKLYGKRSAENRKLNK